MILEQILNFAIKKGASDINLGVGEPIVLRIHGELENYGKSSVINTEKMNKIIHEIFSGNKFDIENFQKDKDVDFSYTAKSSNSFRVNGFYKMGNPAFVLRIIENKVLGVESLGLPKGVGMIPLLKQGLILITGPTGSGKSTTMVAILNQINKTRKEHIITIEDPIEFVFKNDKSVFSQREIGKDTKGFNTALRAAMREDPDIIMIGEMRDKETVSAALELAETGHLVISTLHTSSATQTIIRLLSFFPLEAKNAVSEKISSCLKAILSQRLIPKAEGKGRVGIYELLVANTGIKNQIRTGVVNQIQSSIETGKDDGMVAMKDFADDLCEKGIIKEEDYINYFRGE